MGMMVKLNKSFIFSIFLLLIFFSKNVISMELEDKVRKHIDDYYMEDIFADIKSQIASKIIIDMESANVDIDSSDMEIIAINIAEITSQAIHEQIPDLMVKLMIKYYSTQEIDMLNNLYSSNTNDGQSFAKKNYYFNRELNAAIAYYLYNNLDLIIEEELTKVLKD
tara:strand:- start:18372 stop:18869 length:498 start_codon:yes stop_codon:yes gene_type:complete